MTADDTDLDARLRRVAEALQAPVRPGAGFDARVMARVRAETAAPAWLRWLVEPRTVRLRPVGALAACALAVVALATLLPRTGPEGSSPARAAAAVPVVRFVIAAPGAAQVSVVGDFNDWDAEATPLMPAANGSGVWTVEVPLAPGRHEYAFVVDGTDWRPDPSAPSAAASEYGMPNSVVTVAGSS